MKMCEFPGCEQLGGHGPSTPHARWSAEAGDWVLLLEQRTRGQIAKDARDAARREKAERIAVAHAAQFEHETDPRGGDLYAPILAALTAVAQQALTESENAR